MFRCTIPAFILHSSVLKPYFHLELGKVQKSCDLRSLITGRIPATLKLSFQLGSLPLVECCPVSFRIWMFEMPFAICRGRNKICDYFIFCITIMLFLHTTQLNLRKQFFICYTGKCFRVKCRLDPSLFPFYSVKLKYNAFPEGTVIRSQTLNKREIDLGFYQKR